MSICISCKPCLPLAESNAMPSEDRNVWMELSVEERQLVYARFAERAQRLNIVILDPGLRNWV